MINRRSFGKGQKKNTTNTMSKIQNRVVCPYQDTIVPQKYVKTITMNSSPDIKYKLDYSLVSTDN